MAGKVCMDMKRQWGCLDFQSGPEILLPVCLLCCFTYLCIQHKELFSIISHNGNEYEIDCVCVCVYNVFCCYWCCLVTKSCPTLCDLMDQSARLLSMGFSRKEYWSELPSASPGDLSNPGIEPTSLAWQADSLPRSHLGSHVCVCVCVCLCVCVKLSYFAIEQKFSQGFPGGSEGKASTCNAGDWGSVPGLGRSSGEGNGNPLQYSCLENPHGKRNVVGYSPWGRKESDTAE